MRLVVATPHPEGSTLAIEHPAADDGSLAVLYNSGHASVIARRLPDHLSGAFGLGRYLRRRELPGIPPGLVKDRAEDLSGCAP